MDGSARWGFVLASWLDMTSFGSLPEISIDLPASGRFVHGFSGNPEQPGPLLQKYQQILRVLPFFDLPCNFECLKTSSSSRHWPPDRYNPSHPNTRC